MRDLIKKLYLLAGKESRRITWMLVFSCFKGIFDSWSLGGILYLFTQVVASIQGKPVTLGAVRNIALFMLVSVAGKILCAYLADRNKNLASYTLGAENRLRIGDRLKMVHMGYFSNARLGEITGTVSAAVGDLETVGFTIITFLLVGVIHTVIMAAFMLPFDWPTGCIILITLGFGMAVNGLAQKKLDSLTSVLLKLKVNLAADTLEYAKGIGVLKAFGQNKQGVLDLEASIGRARKGFLDVEKILAPVQFFYMAVFKLGTVVIILQALLRYLRGDLDLVKAMMLMSAAFLVFSGFEMAGSMQNIKGVAVQNLDKVLHMRSLPVISQGSQREIESPSVEYRHLSFSYEEGGREIFHDLCLSIPAGKTTAIVGFSGSGKTTLCNLASRFWDASKGEVLVGGRNVKEYCYDAFLAHFSFVFQDVYLFDDTIRNNIKFGSPQASDEEMIEVAKKSRCHDFIMALPKGYDTVLQEGGSNLSGGERQRISIARAMLKPSSIVILDEATSSVDPENEVLLLEALKNLLKDKTVLVIAHKLNTIQNADQIVVLHQGVEACGTHRELLKKSPTYQRFISYRESTAGWQITPQADKSAPPCI